MTVADLVECIERFCSEAARLPGEELARDLVELARGRNLLDVKFSEMAAAFARTDQYDREGCISPIHWIRVNCHMTAGAAADRVIVGEKAACVPASLAARRAFSQLLPPRAARERPGRLRRSGGPSRRRPVH